MNYKEKLKDIKELDLESDNLEQILNYSKVVCEEEQRLRLIKTVYIQILQHLSLIHRSYRLAIKIAKVPGSEGEINRLMDNCNYMSGKVMYDMCRLLSLSNIDYHSVKNYYDTLLTEKRLKDSYFFDNQMLQTAMQFGRFHNVGDQIYNNPIIDRRKINIPHDVSDDFYVAFRMLNPVLCKILAGDLWEMTSSLSLAVLELEKVEPDIQKYHLEIMEAWLRFTKSMDMVGHTWLSLGRVFTVYYHLLKEAANESN